MLSRNFYRFIISNTTSLRIPYKFTRDHRKHILLDNVVLIVSDDIFWDLSLTVSSDGKLWLQKGWPEFAKHYGLKFGYMLLFNHLGKSVFHVRIFDPTTCEINYSQVIKVPKLDEVELDQSLTQDGDDHVSQESTKKRSRKSAQEAADSFKSDNPFYLVTINLSYSQNWGLYVPVGFLRRYVTRDGEQCAYCNLEMPYGRKWGPIKCRDYESYGKMYGKNWKKFRDENHLGVGDVCVVELLNEVEHVLKVTIFRAS